MARRILRAFKQPFDLKDRKISITASIGIASYPRDGEDVESLTKNADIAMYAAKEGGRNTFKLYAPPEAAPAGPTARSGRECRMTKKNEDKFALVARETGQLIYDYDIASNRIEWGGAVKEVTGFAPEAFPAGIGDWEEMIHPDDRAETVRLLAAARRTGARFQAEYRFRRRDGGFRRIRDVGVFVKGAGGRITRMLGTMTDITKWQKAEEALERSLSLLKATLESTADGILVVDRTGGIQTTNRKFLEMWHIPAELAGAGVDAPMLDHVSAQLLDPEAFLTKVEMAVFPSVSGELRHRRLQGRPRLRADLQAPEDQVADRRTRLELPGRHREEEGRGHPGRGLQDFGDRHHGGGSRRPVPFHP